MLNYIHSHVHYSRVTSRTGTHMSGKLQPIWPNTYLIKILVNMQLLCFTVATL